MNKLTDSDYCGELIKRIQPGYSLYISKFSNNIINEFFIRRLPNSFPFTKRI